MRIYSRVAVALVAAALFLPTTALAQVPPHTPGTICFTPEGWCWAQPPGAPGQPCQCTGTSGTLG